MGKHAGTYRITEAEIAAAREAEKVHSLPVGDNYAYPQSWTWAPKWEAVFTEEAA